jgi:hypothetical protein
MLLVVDILLVSLILMPLCDLVFNERVRVPVKIVILCLTFVWVLYWLFFAGGKPYAG